MIVGLGSKDCLSFICYVSLYICFRGVRLGGCRQNGEKDWVEI